MDELSNLSRDGEHASLNGKPVVLGAVYRLDLHEHVGRLTCAVELRGGGVVLVTTATARDILLVRLAFAVRVGDRAEEAGLVRELRLFGGGGSWALAL